MSKYLWTDDMREISGFGGGYEKTCREMVVAGLEWLDERANADPKFSEYQHIYGLIREDNEDAKNLSEHITKDRDCTGAMHQACVWHILKAREIGWDAYVAKMRELKKEGAEV